MITRYDKPLQILQRPDGTQVYATARPTSITPQSDDVVIIVGEQDRFDIIAQNTYGHASDWWRIAAANGNVNGSLTLAVGSQLIIPRK